MDFGKLNRSRASTKMNKSSSRAHTIISIELKQHTYIKGKKSTKLSVMNLVDLAGSERLSKTKNTGERLQEGITIN